MIWLHRLCLLWLVAAVILFIGFWVNWISSWEAGAYSSQVLIASGLAFLSQGWDKWQARSERRRIPEKWLHFLELIGGWPGAHFGQQLFRHKTFKPGYRRVFLAMIILHILLMLGCLLMTPNVPAA